MTIANRFWNYQKFVPDATIGGHCSPALRALQADLNSRWRSDSLGCYGERLIAGSSSISTHAYGAAIDVTIFEGNQEIGLQMIGYLIGWSEEWRIQAIHDYRRSRIWRAGRTQSMDDACSKWWRAQKRSPNGMGQSYANWLHVEVHPDGWEDARSALDRGVK